MRLAASTVVALASASTVTAALVAKDIVEIMAPKSKACTGDDPNKECRTASQMAPFLIAAAAEYEAYHVNEIVSGLALGLFESGDGRWKKNLNPENHGQGTFNMQGCKFNCLYAQDLEETKDQVQGLDCATISGDQCDGVLELVMPDELNFATPWWFLATQCPESVREALRADLNKGFEEHMKCVGVQVNEKRLAYIELAKKALKQIDDGNDAAPPADPAGGGKESEQDVGGAPQPEAPEASTTSAAGASDTTAGPVEDEEC